LPASETWIPSETHNCQKKPFYIILKINKHVNLQALSYRVGHHSTSDDSTKYRPVDEIDYWKKERNPVNRFRKWVERNVWWSEEKESELRSSIKKQVKVDRIFHINLLHCSTYFSRSQFNFSLIFSQLLQVIQVAEKTEKPPLKYLFSDVYDIPPPNLCEQEKQLRETIYAHPQDYPSDVPL
jgi:2-oxoisovalerate dehydrogenase E1 component alpha subunit